MQFSNKTNFISDVNFSLFPRFSIKSNSSKFNEKETHFVNFSKIDIALKVPFDVIIKAFRLFYNDFEEKSEIVKKEQQFITKL